MKTKDELIKEAYGAHYENCQPDDWGWTTYRQIARGVFTGLHPKTDCGLEDDFFEVKDIFAAPDLQWRPRALKGLEENNGWVSVHSFGFPKEKGLYDFFLEEHGIIMNVNFDPGNNHALKYVRNHTHWQESIVPAVPKWI